MAEEFQVGIFASLSEGYDPDQNKYVERIVYRLHDWCTEGGIDHYKKDGEVLVELRTVHFDGALTREQVVNGMVAGLVAKKTEIQAEAQARITTIEGQINKLLALDYSPAVQEPGFAPRRNNGDVTDVQPRVAKPSFDDDIPF